MEMSASLSKAVRTACAACLALAASAAYAQPVAIVTDVQGRATLDAATSRAPVGVLTELRDGARMSLDAGARAVALYLQSGQHYDLAGPGQVDFMAGGPASDGGASVTRRATPPGKEIRLRATGLAQGGLIVRSGGIRVAAPVRTVLDPSPEFVWHDLRHGLRYRFTLIQQGGGTVFETETDARSLRLPANIALKQGVDYRWRVAPASGDPRPAEAVFRVAEQDLRIRSDALRPGAEATFPDRVAYALWLEDVGLQSEATRAWRELAAARPSDAALRSRAARGN
jgi:hypothetical protein